MLNYAKWLAFRIKNKMYILVSSWDARKKQIVSMWKIERESSKDAWK